MDERGKVKRVPGVEVIRAKTIRAPWIVHGSFQIAAQDEEDATKVGTRLAELFEAIGNDGHDCDIELKAGRLLSEVSVEELTHRLNLDNTDKRPLDG